jgi:hypothetical protein
MANNATLSFGVSGPTMDWTTSISLTEENSQRILNYLVNGSPYGTVIEGEETRPATAEEASQAFARGILRGLLDQTTSWERLEAAKAAAAAIPSIDAE